MLSWLFGWIITSLISDVHTEQIIGRALEHARRLQSREIGGSKDEQLWLRRNFLL
jgi:hypothetical protein